MRRVPRNPVPPVTRTMPWVMRVSSCVAAVPCSWRCASRFPAAVLARVTAQGGGQVTADTIAGDGDAGRVEPVGRALLGDPPQDGEALMQLDGEDRVGDRRVLDEDHREPGADGEVPAESLVVAEVAGDPDAAVEEQDDREVALRPFGPLNVDGDGPAVDGHVLPLDGNPGEVARSGRLESGEGGAHLIAWQQPERGGVLIGLG